MNEELQQALRNPGLYRPYLTTNGESVVDANGLVQPSKRGAALRKEDWLTLDRACWLQFRRRAPLFSMLASNGCMDNRDVQADAPMVLEYDDAESKYKSHTTPIVLIHSEFSFSYAHLRNVECANIPLDTVSGEAAARRVGEVLETYIVKTLTEWSERSTFCNDWSASHAASSMAKHMRDNKKYGIYGFAVGSAFKEELPQFVEIDGCNVPIESTRTWALLPEHALLVHMSQESVKIVMPVQPTLVQLSEKFVFAMLVAVEPRTSYDGNSGVVHFIKA